MACDTNVHVGEGLPPGLRCLTVNKPNTATQCELQLSKQATAAPTPLISLIFSELLPSLSSDVVTQLINSCLRLLANYSIVNLESFEMYLETQLNSRALGSRLQYSVPRTPLSPPRGRSPPPRRANKVLPSPCNHKIQCPAIAPPVLPSSAQSRWWGASRLTGARAAFPRGTAALRVPGAPAKRPRRDFGKGVSGDGRAPRDPPHRRDGTGLSRTAALSMRRPERDCGRSASPEESFAGGPRSVRIASQ